MRWGLAVDRVSDARHEVLRDVNAILQPFPQCPVMTLIGTVPVRYLHLTEGGHCRANTGCLHIYLPGKVAQCVPQ